MTGVDLRRHVAADPASVALLLADPRILPADADPASDRDPVGLVVRAPHRSGVGFTAALEARDAAGTAVRGAVVIRPAPDAGCDVLLRFEPIPDPQSRWLGRLGREFLESLSGRARSRAYAA